MKHLLLIISFIIAFPVLGISEDDPSTVNEVYCEKKMKNANIYVWINYDKTENARHAKYKRMQVKNGKEGKVLADPDPYKLINASFIASSWYGIMSFGAVEKEVPVTLPDGRSDTVIELIFDLTIGAEPNIQVDKKYRGDIATDLYASNNFHRNLDCYLKIPIETMVNNHNLDFELIDD